MSCSAAARDTIEVEVRLGGFLEQHLGLVAHLLDDAAEMRIEFVAVDPAGCLADVDAQIRRPLDVGDDLDRRHDAAEIPGHRGLQGDHLEAPLLEVEGPLVVFVVAEDHVLGALQIHHQQDLGGTRDQFGDAGRHPGNTELDVGELDVELGAQFIGHQPNLPVTYCSVRSSSGRENICSVGLYSTSKPVRRSLSGFTSVV